VRVVIIELPISQPARLPARTPPSPHRGASQARAACIRISVSPDLARAACLCEPGFGGSDCTSIVTEPPCPNDCISTANGICRQGKCLCYPGFHGVDCAIAVPCKDNCNQNGLCQ
jgi:hypothetical protein